MVYVVTDISFPKCTKFSIVCDDRTVCFPCYFNIYSYLIITPKILLVETAYEFRSKSDSFILRFVVQASFLDVYMSDICPNCFSILMCWFLRPCCDDSYKFSTHFISFHNIEEVVRHLLHIKMYRARGICPSTHICHDIIDVILACFTRSLLCTTLIFGGYQVLHW